MKICNCIFGLIGSLAGVYCGALAGVMTVAAIGPSLADPRLVTLDIPLWTRVLFAFVGLAVAALAYLAFRFSRLSFTGAKQFGRSPTLYGSVGLIFGIAGYLTGASRYLGFYLCPLCIHPEGIGRALEFYLLWNGPLNTLTFATAGLSMAGLVQLIKRFTT